MAILSHPAFGPRTALMYVTGGLLLDVWTAVYFFAFVRPAGPVSNMTWFWLFGLFLTGAVFIALGLLLGPLGRAARQAELPPAEAIQAEAAIQQTAAANPPAVVTPNAVAAVPANAAMPSQPTPAPQPGVPAVTR